MKKLSSILKIPALICMFGLLIVFGLHEYHYSFDPYSWLNPDVESVESRNLWNLRKEFYRFWMFILFAGTITFGLYPTISWLLKFGKTRLK